DIDDVWLNVRRSGRGWRIEYRFPSISARGVMELGGHERRQLAPDLSLAAEPARSGVLLQILDSGGSSLAGATARIWAGVRSFSKTLFPWGDDRLGGAERVLLNTFVEMEDSSEELGSR